MNRRPLIAGNWKLHFPPSEAEAYATVLRDRLARFDTIDIAVFPTTLSLDRVQQVLAHSPIGVGSQWAEQPAQGAFTGQSCVAHVRALGCDWALIGHSEVRRDMTLTEDRVARNVHAARSVGLLPMICVGEPLEVFEAGQTDRFVLTQVQAALSGLAPDEIVTCTLAYEPIWAIGTGKTATPEIAGAVHDTIRAWLAAHYPPFVAEQTRILYGGSVKPTTARDLLAQPSIDGLLIGGAALDADAFTAICESAARLAS